jgi:hypothetical protein
MAGQPVPQKAGKKGGKDEDVEDDPIAKSLKERMAAGGLTEVVNKGAAAKGTASDQRRGSTAVVPEEKKVEKAVKPSGAMTARPQTAVKPPAEEKKAAPVANGVKKAGKEDDTDDPIA